MNNLQTTNRQSKVEFRDILSKSLNEATTLKNLLSNNARITHEQFTAKIIGVVMANDKIQQCSIFSIMQCCIKSAQLGLPVDASGYAYIVPRSVKQLDGSWQSEASYQIGYKGYIEIAKRNKQVKSIDAFLVYKNELGTDSFIETRGSDARLVYKPNYSIARDDQDIALAVAVVSYKNGGSEWDVMTLSEINKAKDVSIKKDKFGKDNFSPWSNWWGEMAKKTVLRRLLKRCCLINIDNATELDEDEQLEKLRIKAINLKTVNESDEIPDVALSKEIQTPSMPISTEYADDELLEINIKAKIESTQDGGILL